MRTATRRRPAPPAVHPKFRRPVAVPARRRAELLATIEAAALELFPDAEGVLVTPRYPTPLNEPAQGRTDAVRFRRPPRPAKAGTVADLAGDVHRAVYREMEARGYRWDDPDPVLPAGWRHDHLVGMIALLRALADRAGEIPAAEFTPADWQAFVALLPERFHDRKEPASKTLTLTAGRLRAAGLNLGGTP